MQPGIDFPRAVGVVRLSAPEIIVAPDSSPVFTRDLGSQEIHALNVRWP